MEDDFEKDQSADVIQGADGTTLIKEGSTEIYTKGKVFYNPVQQFNRDLSISVISTFSKLYQEELRIKNKESKKDENEDAFEQELTTGEKHNNGLVILEALSATGLRSIRYAKEIPGIKEIIANDFSKNAVESIKYNIKQNNVNHLVVPSFSDAMTLMYLSTAPEKRFTVIDLDPYGSPARFLDGAVQSLTDGGLLLVTATDMAVLAGNSPEACFVKYGSIPLRNKACHEMGIRILLRTIESSATRYGRYIQPLLSISADFYIRVFVRIFTGQLACKKSSSKQSMVFQCTGCDTFTLQPLGVIKPNPSQSNPNQIKYGLPTGPFVNNNCEHCNHHHHLGGPIWSDPIHDYDFVKSVLQTVSNSPFSEMETYSRIVGVLNVIHEELPDVPLYYRIDKMCSILKLEIVPILKFRSAILHSNYQVSFSHASKSSIKTNAPAGVLWDILRCWAKTHPVKPERFIEHTPLKAILSKNPEREYDLNNLHPLANPESRKNSLVRFPENPAAYWGPGTRSTVMLGDNKMMKSIRNQNKNKKRLTKEEYLERKKIKTKKSNNVNNAEENK